MDLVSAGKGRLNDMKSIRIGNRMVGEGCPVFIIAELSANHLQDFSVAVKTVKAMKRAGADAVKFQTYTPDTITLDSTRSCFKIKSGSLWKGKTLYQLYREAYTPWAWQPKLARLAHSLGLVCFSSPFDKSAVDFLETLKMPAYKVASFEITDTPLIEYIASKGKPVILSTGVAELPDIRAAVRAYAKTGSGGLALLKCTSSYPASPEESNLRTIPDLASRFGCVVGVSDHTRGIAVAVAAVALGAKIVEKHFILDRALGGPDAAFSSQPEEFAAMVSAVRDAEKSLGTVTYRLSHNTRQSRRFCRSLFAVKNIRRGERFTQDNVRSIRPGCGLPPGQLSMVLNACASKKISSGTPLRSALIDRRSRKKHD